MKKKLHKYMLLCLFVASCTSAHKNPVTPTVTVETLSTATTTETHLPFLVLTSTPYRLVLPSVTMLPQENESALLELLKTNGNCIGKCIGGIRPDEMTVQDAVNVMAQWGMVTVNKNSQGKTFINLDQNQIQEQMNVYLSVGTWSKELETIDTVTFRIDGVSGSNYVKEDVWLSNRDVFQGVGMDKLLKAYGIPSYVGYDFSSLLSPSAPTGKGERFSYGMNLHFDQINLHILIGAKAYYDGESVFLCPSKEPHYMLVEINPERPLKELRNVFPVTWQALTDTDLNAYYQAFTGENAFDVCVATNMEKILRLQP